MALTFRKNRHFNRLQALCLITFWEFYIHVISIKPHKGNEGDTQIDAHYLL